MPVAPKTKPRRPRAKKPKVRTGCITCKIRRVKCDETRPSCNRCIKFGWVCDGYLQIENRRVSSTSSVRTLVAKQEWLLATPSREPCFALFENDVEGRYYRLFCETTAERLGGYYDPDLWNRIILQASIGVSSIRHVVIALAALDLTSLRTTSKYSGLSLSGEDCGSNTVQQHQFALRQYSRAIKEMREDISNTKHDLRSLLIASILIICFEAYHGNYDAALAQFRTGQKMLDEWMAKQNDVLDDGFSSPAPYEVEDELIRTFNNLEIQALIHTDIAPLDVHVRLKNFGTNGVAKMPKEFHTIKEALMYGKAVIRRCVHFMSMSWMYDDDNPAPPENSFTIMDRVSSCTDPEAFREQDKYAKELIRWHSAFLPLLYRARTLAGKDDFFAATCLQMHYHVTHIGVVSALATNELFYDSLTPLFVEIVDLARTVFETSQKSNFTCAFRCIFPLDLVAKKCRDPTIRREAIQLLLSRPRREIFWDSIIAAKICLWVVQIEEEDMVDDYVSEEMRVRNIGVKFKLDEQKLFVSCKQRKKGGGDQMVLRKVTFVL